MPIANTCRIGYPHDGRADNAAYRHDRRADKRRYWHDRRADSLSHILQGTPETVHQNEGGGGGHQKRTFSVCAGTNQNPNSLLVKRQTDKIIPGITITAEQYNCPPKILQARSDVRYRHCLL